MPCWTSFAWAGLYSGRQNLLGSILGNLYPGRKIYVCPMNPWAIASAVTWFAKAGPQLREEAEATLWPEKFYCSHHCFNAVPFPKFLTLTFQFQALSCMQILPKQNGEYCRFWNDPGSVLYNLTFFLVFYSWLQFLPFSQAVDERKNEQDGWVKYSPRVEA